MPQKAVITSVTEALLPILGERVSASTVSRISRMLDESMAAFHKLAASIADVA